MMTKKKVVDRMVKIQKMLLDWTKDYNKLNFEDKGEIFDLVCADMKQYCISDEYKKKTAVK